MGLRNSVVGLKTARRAQESYWFQVISFTQHGVAWNYGFDTRYGIKARSLLSLRHPRTSLSDRMKTLVLGNCSSKLHQAKCFKPVPQGPRCCVHCIHSLPVLGWSVFKEYQRCRLIHWRQLMMWWQEQALGSHSQTAILVLVTDQNTRYCIGSDDTVLGYPSGIRCNVCTKKVILHRAILCLILLRDIRYRRQGKE